MKIARVIDNAVVEVREGDLSLVPIHKRMHWRLVVEQPPVYSATIENVYATGWQITDTEAIRQYTVTPIPRERLIQRIKDEAQRRIIILCGAVDFNSCIVRQLNMLKRVGQLNNKLAKRQTLTQDEETEAAKLEALAQSIDHLRARSNELEALDPIPADYADDVRWQ